MAESIARDILSRRPIDEPPIVVLSAGVLDVGRPSRASIRGWHDAFDDPEGAVAATMTYVPEDSPITPEHQAAALCDRALIVSATERRRRAGMEGWRWIMNYPIEMTERAPVRRPMSALSTRMGCASSQIVSPVVVCFRPTTATMSPV